ncbi:hypothetical protein Pen02_77260 [Plantactinospora endophytica]|uniref:Uncharacterized protein n=1 Tax=Plantactinospora endophytica TaxID=673535 RepID=A0ABQ4EDJ5_9ACTN|nr:hypothetical protein Pen02_77260 [Plantactinospora endophytica]
MTVATAMPADEERLRPLYARVLRLRHVDPGGMLCFVFFEGTVALGLLLALAELVHWWGVFVLPAAVAVMVKINDVVAAAVLRSAARVPAQERERFRREIQPAIGRASVPKRSLAQPGQPGPTERLSAPGPDTSESGNAPSRPAGQRLPIRFLPVARPFSMTAVVRARLELGGRRRPRVDPAGPERADGGGPGQETARPPTGLPQARTASSSSAAPVGRARNSGLAERLDQRPVRRWLSRQDPIDTSRQSARRRYK